jgi:hypothetical protein
MAAEANRIGERLAGIAARSASVVVPPIVSRKPQQDRGEPREKVYRFARLRLPDDGVINCVVLDLSRSGARVKFESVGKGLPEYVVLEFEASGVTKRARVAWERDLVAGLQFLDPTQRIFGCRPSAALKAPAGRATSTAAERA